jgi:hypothetical protein
MTKRHCERKKTGREPKSNGKILYVPPPPPLAKRSVGIPTAGTAGSGPLCAGWHFAITRQRGSSAPMPRSPGPWRTERSKYVRGSYVITADNTTAVHATEWGEPSDDEPLQVSGRQRFDTPDFRFAAEARTLVPELIAEVERLNLELTLERNRDA